MSLIVPILTRRGPTNAILAPNFKFEDMGIGGLDTEFAAIFRRAFASRIFPPGLVDKLGIQHVKGESALSTGPRADAQVSCCLDLLVPERR